VRTRTGPGSGPRQAATRNRGQITRGQPASAGDQSKIWRWRAGAGAAIPLRTSSERGTVLLPLLLPFGVQGRRSGRTGGGCRQSLRCRGPSGVRTVGRAAGEQPPTQAAEEAGKASAIDDDGMSEFIPECPVDLAGCDAQVTADIGDDGADRAPTHLGGDTCARRGSSV
jgi:hypothetical protein